MHLNRQSSIAELFGTSERIRIGALDPVDQINVGARTGAQPTHGLEQRQQSLNSHGHSTGRRGLSTHLLNKPIVASATTDGALCAEFVGHPLEHGEVVIVESSDQTRIESIRNTCGLQGAQDPLLMRKRLGPEKIGESRRTLDETGHRRIL